MTKLTSTAETDFTATLARAVAHKQDKRSDRPAAKEVVNALLQAEKATKQQRLIYPLELLIGNWRLYFTAPRQAHLKDGTALGKGFYIPQFAPAQISFTQVSTSEQSPGQLEIGNQVQFGSLRLKLTGPAQYLGKKNLLAFNFTQMQILLLGRTIYSGGIRGGKNAAMDFYQQSVAKLPFFAFFLVTEDLIAARGRGGGLALWAKEERA